MTRELAERCLVNQEVRQVQRLAGKSISPVSGETGWNGEQLQLSFVVSVSKRFTWNQEPFCKTRMPIHRICFYSGISGNPPVFSPFRYELPPRHSRKLSMPWRLLCVDYCSPFARLPTGRNKCLIFPCVPFLPFP